MASTVMHLACQYIEQERVLLFADELIVQSVSSPINPGSLTMGFAGADPRQLAPSVGTTQVGITILAVPSSANRNPRARTRSSPLEGFNITAKIFATPAASIESQPRQIQCHGNDQAWRQRRRNRRPRRQAQGLYTGIPLDESQHAAEDSPTNRRPTATRAPAA